MAAKFKAAHDLARPWAGTSMGGEESAIKRWGAHQAGAKAPLSAPQRTLPSVAGPAC